MTKKFTFQYVYEFIKSKGDELISKSYNDTKSFLEVKCGKCGDIYNQKFCKMKHKRLYHENCKNDNKKKRINPLINYKKPKTLKPIICKMCNIEFQPKESKSKLCSKKCADEQWRTDEYRQKAKENGKVGGKLSATRQSKRSKNEIYFSELCQQYFTITTNEPYFDGWDADVIIHSDKIAILWNGAWHYKQISKTQSLKQVQNRDKIKEDIIGKYGYTPYIIKDMGKYNRSFVEQEFEIFLLMRIEIY